ncbi:hypothetical protein CYMTET_30145 [Cymbomonas tetramitiformis]|uniref:USP domain-containing protein n=1 Tax=Cymbomonas tetramitiformis TaxID=36881 RepID=A0AAE0KU86_9CHLO|nr:hypothetical protein CYMTET_30145 [Cymbomonas tetramitiformis]
MSIATMGHYVAYVRLASGTWALCDDGHITEVTAATVLSQKAYMLFYRRCAPRPAPLPCSVSTLKPADSASDAEAPKSTKGDAGSVAPPAPAATVPSPHLPRSHPEPSAAAAAAIPSTSASAAVTPSTSAAPAVTPSTSAAPAVTPSTSAAPAVTPSTSASAAVTPSTSASAAVTPSTTSQAATATVSASAPETPTVYWIEQNGLQPSQQPDGTQWPQHLSLKTLLPEVESVVQIKTRHFLQKQQFRVRVAGHYNTLVSLPFPCIKREEESFDKSKQLFTVTLEVMHEAPAGWRAPEPAPPCSPPLATAKASLAPPVDSAAARGDAACTPAAKGIGPSSFSSSPNSPGSVVGAAGDALDSPSAMETKAGDAKVDGESQPTGALDRGSLKIDEPLPAKLPPAKPRMDAAAGAQKAGRSPAEELPSAGSHSMEDRRHGASVAVDHPHELEPKARAGNADRSQSSGRDEPTTTGPGTVHEESRQAAAAGRGASVSAEVDAKATAGAGAGAETAVAASGGTPCASSAADSAQCSRTPDEPERQAGGAEKTPTFLWKTPPQLQENGPREQVLIVKLPELGDISELHWDDAKLSDNVAGAPFMLDLTVADKYRLVLPLDREELGKCEEMKWKRKKKELHIPFTRGAGAEPLVSQLPTRRGCQVTAGNLQDYLDSGSHSPTKQKS